MDFSEICLHCPTIAANVRAMPKGNPGQKRATGQRKAADDAQDRITFRAPEQLHNRIGGVLAKYHGKRTRVLKAALVHFLDTFDRATEPERMAMLLAAERVDDGEKAEVASHAHA